MQGRQEDRKLLPVLPRNDWGDRLGLVCFFFILF
jgi:hypothetical protein